MSATPAGTAAIGDFKAALGVDGVLDEAGEAAIRRDGIGATAEPRLAAVFPVPVEQVAADRAKGREHYRVGKACPLKAGTDDARRAPPRAVEAAVDRGSRISPGAPGL